MSKSKKPGTSLDDLVGPIDRPDPTAPSEAVSHLPAPPPAPAPAPPRKAAKAKGGGLQISTFVTYEDRTRLRAIANVEGTSIHELLREGLNLALAARREPPVAPQAANRNPPREPSET